MKEKTVYQSILDHSPVGYVYHRVITDSSGNALDHEVIETNIAFGEIVGLQLTEIIGNKMTRVFPAIGDFDWVEFYGTVTEEGAKEEFEQYSEYEDIWFSVHAYSPQPGYFITFFNDISRNKKLLKQKAHFEALFTNTNDAMVFFDTQENITNTNFQFTKMFGYRLEEVKGKYVNQVVDPFQKSSEYGSPKTLRGETMAMESIRYRKDGQAIQVSLKGGPVYNDGVIIGGYTVYADITERKRSEEELKYLSLHDRLTSLYNRTFFEEEVKRLDKSREYPITIISADVDGLKLINDTMGHDSGDELLKISANVLKQSLRSSDILARIGGDEFAILLPLTDTETGKSLMRRIQTNIQAYNTEKPRLPLNISMGIATAKNSDTSLKEVYKKADDFMYISKLHKASSTKTKIIENLMETFGQQENVEGKRLAMLCQQLGKKKGLNPSQLKNISVLAKVHNIGMVGILDTISSKNDVLTEAEKVIMHQHSEKGYRLASLSPDLVGIADLILKHHERWDGTGYPLGLKGEEIPVECRILSIADAFYAITNDRPYSKAKTVEEAFAELRSCSGTQFDPELVEMFGRVLQKT